MPHKCGELSSDNNLDHRMVLPKAQHDASGGQPHRRVILPEGKPKSQLVMPTEAALQQSHASSTSKLSTARQACEEELEFLKLKLRYMQNDIEFKQKQIDSAKTSKPKGSTTSQQWNHKRQHISAQAIPAASFSHQYPVQKSNLHHNQSATTWTASVAFGENLKTKADISDKDSYLQRKNIIPSTTSINYHSSASSKSNESSIVTKSNTFPKVAKSNNSSTLYAWSSYLKDGTSSGKLRPTSNAINFKKLPSEFVGALPNHNDFTHIMNTNPASTQQINVILDHLEHTQTQQTNYPASSSYPAGLNVLPYGPKAELQLSYPASTAGTTTSAFERLSNQRLSQIPPPVCISPDKRLVLYPSKTVPLDVSPTDLTQRSCQTVSSPTAAENYTANNVLHKYNPRIQDISNFSHSGNHMHLNRHSGKTGSTTTSLSKYKLVKNSSSLPTGTTLPASSSLNSNFSLSSHADSNILHEDPSSLVPTRAATAVRRASQGSRLSLRIPNLKVQTAAKLVSKYKLKRLSPTTASLTSPPLFYSKKSALIYEQDHHKHFGPYVQPQHKLDRRLMTNSSSTPTLTFKKPVGNIYSVLTKKHKIDRRPFSNHPWKTARIPHDTLVRSKLKVDKRVTGSHIFHDKLGSAGIQNVHTIDRRNVQCEYEKLTSPRHGIKHSWVSSEHISHSAGKGDSRSKRFSSKFNWKTAGLQQSQISGPAASQNSRFKWSRPNFQAQNGAWQQLRQKLQLMLNKKHRHSRFTFSKYPTLSPAPSIYNRTSKVGDYKTNLVTIDGIMYKSSRSKLTRARRSSAGNPVRKTVPVQNSRSGVALKCQCRQKQKLISVRGVHFHVDPSGKKLCRTDSAAVHSSPASARKISASHSDFNIVNFANRAVHRSKLITAARFKKSNNKSKNEAPHCIFFGRFGKCHRGDKCSYVHDPEKVAVCTRFLRGTCDAKGCPFSHKASPNKLPVCLFFLRGSCFKENCPYLHVRVNPNAPVCKDFRNGFCTLGEKCKKIHSHVCPSFAMTGTCSRAGTCTMLHRKSKREMDGLPAQAKSLAKKPRKPSQVDLRKLARESQALKSGASVFTPTSTAALKAQPSFISLESNPMPSFISLETGHHKGSGESDMQVPHQKTGLAQGTVGLSVLGVGQPSSPKDTAQSIRPSFLAKKFISDKTTE